MEFNGLTDWFEVFKAGTWTDSSGKERTFSQQDLDNIVQKYDPEKNEAPFVFGHPKTDAPAFGWVESLKREGDTLFAKGKQIVSEFEENVKGGLYKKRSIALNPDMSLKHIGFLGAVPPAVKGLKDISFSEDDDLVIYEFSEFSQASWRINTVGRIFSRLRDFIIEKYDLDTADKIIDTWAIENLTSFDDEEKTINTFNEIMEEILTMGDKTQKTETNPKDNAEFSAQLSAKDAEIATLKANNAKLEAANRQAEFSEFCDGLVKEGKMTPAQKTYVMNFMEIAHGVGEFEFSEGDKTEKKQAIEKFKEFLGTLPKQISFGEFEDTKKKGDNAYFAQDDAEMALAEQIAKSIN